VAEAMSIFFKLKVVRKGRNNVQFYSITRLFLLLFEAVSPTFEHRKNGVVAPEFVRGAETPLINRAK